MRYRYFIFIALAAFVAGCQPELDEFSVSKGNADFTTYVALGNSLTAGYADGALYRTSQLNSYPTIIAEQFKKAGGGEFIQPLMEGEYGIDTGKLILGFTEDCNGVKSLAPIPSYGLLDNITPIGYAVNNLGVPGAKSFHLLAPGYGNIAGIGVYANPYFVRFATEAASTVIIDAKKMNPTFYTLWIGSNDVLAYALTGGSNDSITDQFTFTFVMDSIIRSMNETGAKGAIASIPDMLKAPFFKFMGSQVPYNGLVLTEQGQVDGLNAAYQQLGITFSLGQNPFIVEDAVTHFPRKMHTDDIFLLTLPSDSLKCYGMGSMIPIPHKYILDETEIDNIETAINIYNNVILNLANSYGLAYIEMFDLMTDLENGIITNGVTLTTEFVSGNAFSLDGIHLTPMGYAYIANQFISGINAKFGSTLPLVSITDYQSVVLP